MEKTAVSGLLVAALQLGIAAACHCQEVRRQLQADAKALAPLVTSDFAKRFIATVDRLPRVEPRSIYRNPQSREYLSQAQFEKLPDAERKTLKPVQVDESLYYVGRYGSPLAYVRALDLVAMAGGLKDRKAKVLDFGYGAIGQIEMLAALGIDVVGVDVDPLLPAIYSDAIQGSKQRSAPSKGAVLLLDGKFPGDAKIRAATGSGYDLLISKNTLKNGYIHPAEKVDKRLTIDLGVSDEAFVQAMHSVLKPGGFVMIYNLCPAPALPGKPYIPWADGRCPFPKAALENVGFRVIGFDVDDAEAAQAMAHALGWDRPPSGMDLKKDLFVWYTLLQRK